MLKIRIDAVQLAALIHPSHRMTGLSPCRATGPILRHLGSA
ncbi:MAG: hypothetical protein OJF51_001072 [Nitrospira sp.]|nr:MAG: hypothetical protein OJF51_001072 [Nitrospira sp.]